LAIAAIVAICIGGPIVEMFDQWDQTAWDGNDTEANVVIAALCIGVGVAIRTMAVVARIRASWSNDCGSAVACSAVFFPVPWFAVPIPTSSPPTPLRV
jgi:hypothetical protein